jgi:microcystin-dependent protein
MKTPASIQPSRGNAVRTRFFAVAASLIAACSTAPTLDDSGADASATDGDATSRPDVALVDSAAESATDSATDSGAALDVNVDDATAELDATVDDRPAALDASDGSVATDAGSMDSGIAVDARADARPDSAPDALPDSAPDALPDVRCPGTQTTCGSTCVDTQTDLMNCGACAVVCPRPPTGTPACIAGRCGATPGSQTTEPAGSATAIQLGQPSLAVTMVVAQTGVYPSRDSFAVGSALGMVHLFAGGFGPNGALLARGQLLPIATNTALFSLLGTTYGGDGRVNFALPDLQERFLVAAGTGAGLPAASLGVVFGSNSATLSIGTMPAHSHLLADGMTRTSSVGRGEPLDLRAPSMPVTAWVSTEGTFPSPGGGVSMPFLGQIRWFAGNFTPTGGWVPADGRLLSIADNSALFAVVGTTYGGDGVRTFAVPDLRGRVPVGVGPGPGLPPITAGQFTGASSIALGSPQLATHQHALVGGGATQTAGNSQSFSAYQPSLGITWLIATQGIFPARDGSGFFDDSNPFLGEIIAFAGTFAPRGFITAEGQLLPIATNAALFSLLGTAYGGDGRANFALPDLRGRGPIGASATVPVGTRRGSPSRTLVTTELPAHSHTF